MNLEQLKSPLGSKASMMVQSNLSDILIEMGADEQKSVERINFIKFLVSITDGDLTVRLCPNKVTIAWEEFQNNLK